MAPERPTDVPTDEKAFRTCLGQFPTGVCIVTANVGGELAGMTISSFNSLSLDPPLVLFSIGRKARSLALWERAEALAINMLSESQQALSNRFARPGGNKWEGLQFSRGLGGAPLLAGCVAILECLAHGRHDAGDHRLVIAEVKRFTTNPARAPLVFCKGAYNALKPRNEPAALWPLDIHY